MISRALSTAICVAAGLPLFLIQHPSLAVDGTPFWFESTVSEPGGAISSPVLAFNHFGTPSVSWSSSTAGIDTVYRSERLGLGLWAHREVASGPTAGMQTALSFDRAERPTVAWIDGNGHVKAEFDNSGVHVSVANGADTVNPVLSISHDLAGNLRGLFTGTAAGDLFDIGSVGGAFSSSSLTTLSGIDEVLDARLTTDHSGLRHVVARVQPESGSGQSVVIASEPSFDGPWPSLALTTADEVHGIGINTDPTDGNVALSYTTYDTATNTSKLFYAKFNGFALEATEVLSSTTAIFYDVDLAFDLSDGRPAIAFEREVVSPLAEELVFAYLDGASQWQTSLVDDSISISSSLGGLRRPSLAFDDFGTSWPAIAYIDADESLNVAFDPPVPVPEPGTAGLMAAGLVILSGRSRRRR
ncbi:MAG: PEP-CTERM sorting domain-containing protein [Phycisphaerales bacterium]|nr:PEP-CTERM sorting domain-containing protein [Phycisphaerales bacterium]